MKNIHLIPTDKPTRLHNKNGDLGNYPSTKLYIEDFKGNQHNSFHIYITSDEEIKEGDWILNPTNEVQNCIGLKKGIGTDNICWVKVKETTTLQQIRNSQKIILTTDPNLNNYGVQAIDDEFLEWFVKNPSCEEVETKLVEFEVDMELGDSCIEYGSYYEIIIPSEEPTAYHYLSCCRSIEECHCGKYPKQIKCYCGHTITCDCSPIDELTQETLEEIAEKVAKRKYGSTIYDLEMVDAFIEGAKWQQERSYSEEEVRNLFRNYQYDSAQFAAIMEGDTDGKPTPTGWFEKFKKK